MWLIPESSPTAVKWTETAADEMKEGVKCLQKKFPNYIMFNLKWKNLDRGWTRVPGAPFDPPLME